MQGWAANLAWGGADVRASSGMMKDFEKRGGRSVDTDTYDGDKPERPRKNGEALQRQMRRRVAEHELQSIHARAPAAEFY